MPWAGFYSVWSHSKDLIKTRFLMPKTPPVYHEFIIPKEPQRLYFS